MPGIIVNTRCTINDGYDFDDVLEAARAVDLSSVGGPDLVSSGGLLQQRTCRQTE